ncbi:PIN domain-containing protein [Rhodococcus opacus]|uniref:PIN domain-containing protein n=1 Tax=Rhodococcus opacus TaxID=37919 RepID=UPI003CD004CF
MTDGDDRVPISPDELNLQRDFLMSMAVEGLYRPLWSGVILDELEFHEAAKLERRHSAATAQAAGARLVGTMREHFDDALVTGWEPLEGTFSLPDPDDEHVVAAAVVGGPV